MLGATLLGPASRPQVLARLEEYQTAAAELGRAVAESTGRPTVLVGNGWVGVQMADEWAAAWFVRACVADSVLARREEATLYLPVPDPVLAAERSELVCRLARLYRLWVAVERQ